MDRAFEWRERCLSGGCGDEFAETEDGIIRRYGRTSAVGLNYTELFDRTRLPLTLMCLGSPISVLDLLEEEEESDSTCVPRHSDGHRELCPGRSKMLGTVRHALSGSRQYTLARSPGQMSYISAHEHL